MRYAQALAADPVIWLALWVVVAGALSAFPSRRHHWPPAYALMVPGLPLLVWCWIDHPAKGIAALAVGALVFRWPLRYLMRWARARAAR